LKFIGGSLTLEHAKYCIIDGCDMKYITHFETIDYPRDGMYNSGTDQEKYSMGPSDFADGSKGIFVSGSYNVIKNSLISVSAGSGIIVGGQHISVTNCRIQYCNYAGTYHAGIATHKQGAYGPVDIDISRNTMKGMTRSCIYPSSTGNTHGQGNNIRITYNDLSMSSLGSGEAGTYYIVGGHGWDTEIAYNWFHSLDRGGTGHIGLDFGHTRHYFHHNVFYNGHPFSDMEIYCNICMETGVDISYNNTFISKCMQCSPSKDTIETGRGPKGINCIYAYTDTSYWNFSDPDRFDYSLTASSPARDRGQKVLGFPCNDRCHQGDSGGSGTTVTYKVTLTDYEGSAPDLGAYEYGKPRWVAGADWQERPWSYPPSPAGAQLLNSGWNRGFAAPAVLIRGARLTVAGAAKVPYRFMLFDMRGNLLMQQTKPSGGVYHLNGERFPPGTYFACVHSIEGNSRTPYVKWTIAR
jgi:hypothetical protein